MFVGWVPSPLKNLSFLRIPLPYFDSRCYNRHMYRIITTTKAIDVNANWTLTIGGVTYFFKWLWMKAAIPERDIVNLMYSG